MANLSPSLAVAGLGAFHGLSPANGWMFAVRAACVRATGASATCPSAHRRRAHVASVAVVACAFSLGTSIDRTLFQDWPVRCSSAWRRTEPRGAGQHTSMTTQASHAGIALSSF